MESPKMNNMPKNPAQNDNMSLKKVKEVDKGWEDLTALK